MEYTIENAHKKFTELVTRFDEQYKSYKHSDYNETLTRRDFIDPFFKALGWDMDNENGYAESYREVIHEDKIKVSGATKAPDYSFRLVGGKRLFFVEAKKPSVQIKDEIAPAFQIRRYGWSAKMPISIITDFEEFAIYDCTKKPLPTDKASTARIKYLTYPDYLKEFEFIWDTFSKERVLKGSFDKFVQNDTYKKGTATVDNDFLQSLDSWRTHLATSIALKNKHLDEDEINFVVQQTIDRIIFLRIAEDRSVEPYGNLKDSIKEGNLYQNLYHLFVKADEKYNSGLFDFNKDKLSHNLEIDNKVIRTIISDLYYPSPYAFSVMPVEILGTAYEQFLGKVIHITPSHHAKIEEKPDVRKAGGVYYTPQYVVEYIVQNTVGHFVEGKLPKEISKVKIVDPACGSGSFLLGAYQYLLDFHKNYYTNNGKIIKGDKNNVLTPDGNLTTAEKKRILINNIYGVDIDVNAVEVTKLSLLLKCMEGETEASIITQMRLFHDRVLPTLDNNIRSGNSLIDTDYYDNQFDFGEEKKIKPFNWQKAFPEVFEQGGFDIVIGNPPYVKEYTNREAFEHIKKSHLRKYYQGKMDLWYFFACYALDILKTKGLLGFIVPNNWVTNAGASILRNKIITDSKIHNIVDFGSFMVFNGASIQTMIMIMGKNKANNYLFDYRKIEVEKPDNNLVLSLLNKQESHGLKYLQPKITVKHFIDKFLLFGDNVKHDLLLKIELKGNFILDKKKEVAQGIVAPQDFLNKAGEKELKNAIPKGTGIFTITQTEKNKINPNEFEEHLIKPYYTTKELGRFYGTERHNLWIIYTDSTFKNENKIRDFPNLKRHLNKFKNIITSDNAPYGLHRAREEKFFIGEKIISLRKCAIPTFTYTDFDCYVSQTFYIIKSDRINLKYLTAILNSKVVAYWLRNKGKMQGNQYQIDKEPLLQIPILDVQNESIKEEVIKFVDSLLKLIKQKQESNLQSKIEQLQIQVDYCEGKINEIIYKLYGLTDEEIKVIETQ